jgi:NAD-dependent SIR2 family protein deacetylase
VNYAVARAAELLAGRRAVVLTGAGISTDSGIPDYRGGEPRGDLR